jgi:hypothetical protein
MITVLAASSSLSLDLLLAMSGLLVLKGFHVRSELIETVLPALSIISDPCGRRLEWSGVESNRAVLRVATACHEPGAFEYLEVFRNRGLGQAEGLY